MKGLNLAAVKFGLTIIINYCICSPCLRLVVLYR